VGAIEYAWNVYPSTVRSSAVLCVSHVILLGGIWFGRAEDRVLRTGPVKSEIKRRGSH
jgi:alpha-1,3-mannosyltransferase